MEKVYSIFAEATQFTVFDIVLFIYDSLNIYYI